MKFKKSKFKLLHLVQGNQRQEYRRSRTESSLVEKDLTFFWMKTWRGANSAPLQPRDVILPLYSALADLTWTAVFSTGASSPLDIDPLEGVQRRP